MQIVKILATELGLKETQVEATVKLIDEGNTIPFIARYRKEATGSLDDNVLRDLEERLTYLRNLAKRKEEVKASIENLGLLTSELEEAIINAKTLAEIEDIYRPYKPKRRTRASMAKERGLEPLLREILSDDNKTTPITLAQAYIDEEKGVETAEDALKGAMDIAAEEISDNAAVRAALREYMLRNSLISAKGKTEEESVYSIYYDFSEAVSKIPGHRILAIDRGERENMLSVSIDSDEIRINAIVTNTAVPNVNDAAKAFMKEAVEDSISRLIYPSMENEVRNTLTDNAATSAIKLFAVNLHQLLMQAPVKGRVALGLDPAYRTGCKIAVVDETGKVLDTTVIYPTPPMNKIEEAAKKIKAMINKYGITVIAIGNGTASKEAEIFVAGLIKEIDAQVEYMMVSESGASVYSASKLAAKEFPEYDVSLRSAVSIARRLQDPLAELVKIDPKAIGVGQYQHDMPQNKLGLALGGVVEDCVNSVGVDLNTASVSLLSYVAGIGNALAENIISYREENGAFSDRKELLKVKKLGKKAFEQCAGFLRVPESDNIFDKTAVHPESYKAATSMLVHLGYKKAEIDKGELNGLKEKLVNVNYTELAKELGIGEPTLRDISAEILKPGRDPRDTLPLPMLRSDLLDINDLKEDMIIDGTVRNITDFGAFVDIGVHQDGLVHISQMADRYIKHPTEAVKVGDIVKVKILQVDAKRKRISLSMKGV